MSSQSLSSDNLTLLEFAKSRYPLVSLKNTLVIAVQHLLGTVHEMFRSWFSLGLKAENLHILGKCYSSNRKVADEMKASGIQMSPYSFDFDSHIAYDDLFEDIVQKFLESSLDHVKDSERIILLDDGGHLINAALKLYPKDCKHIVAVEQTTSGYERLKNSSLDFPIINVAKSKAKLMYEPGFAAGLIIERTLQKLTRAPRNILIMGKGAIGMAIHARLSNDYEVQFWDIINRRGKKVTICASEAHGVPNDASSEGVRMPDQSEAGRVSGVNSKTIDPRARIDMAKPQQASCLIFA